MKKLLAGFLLGLLLGSASLVGALVQTEFLAGTNGAVGAPVFSFTSDSDTGLYRIGAGILGVATDGVERIRFTTATDDTIFLGDGVNYETVAIPDCDGATATLRYDTGLNTFSCATAAFAPLGARYWVGTADATLTAEMDLGALTTGLVLNTVAAGLGTPSAYTGTSCTDQHLSALNASGIGTCTTDVLASAQHANQGTITQVLHGNAAGNPAWGSVVSADLAITATTCTNQFLTALSATAIGTCTTATLASAQFANQGTTTTVLHGNAAGNPSWAAVSLTADVTGTLPVGNGGTGITTCTNDQVVTGGATLNCEANMTFNGTLLDLLNGQIRFPATQVPSAGGNTLDDYEEGTWTPVVTFTTPGDLSVVYSTQVGSYTKIGRLVTATFNINTSTFTYTTASGNLQVTGLPFTSSGTAGNRWLGALAWQGITKAGYTDLKTFLSTSDTVMVVQGSGSGQTISNVSTTDAPTGSAVILRGTITYWE